MQVHLKIKIRILLALAGICVPPTAAATTLVRLSLDQLAAEADAVARARCAGSESRWEDGAIWTVTTFDIVDSMKGNLGQRLVVRLPGGRVGYLTATVDGTPKFTTGEDVVLFLQQMSAGGFSVAGWVEGTFRIALDPKTRRETVTQDSSTFAVLDPATRAFHTEGIRHVPIEQFQSRVAAAIAHARGKTR